MNTVPDRFPEFPQSAGDLEEEILATWAAEETFAKSLERTADGEPYVFFEGPPTANGRPGIHHVLARTIKDVVARFRTMEGRYVPRMAGWDTHGLPVEIEAERRLGISGKPEIEKIGIARFNEVCRDSVLTYTEEWERFSARIGYWLDYSRPYVTYHRDYIESIWWSLKQIAERDLFYRGHKILPYCPRCGTGLSSHEVALGYRDVKDPSLYLILPLTDGSDRSILVWTTTPWTLVSNVALAVDPELTYAEVEHEGRVLVLAEERVAALFGAETPILKRFPGSELLGVAYRRPFDWVSSEGVGEKAWTVVGADFVTAEDGTGVVHIAPAYGADDYALGVQYELPVFRPVADDGTFPPDFPLVGGRFVKDSDADLVKDLRGREQVFAFSREEHSYPHCWRCGSPLLYMARDSWFIRTTAVKDSLLANNEKVSWHPPEVGSGRFGEWLENNVDWAISRNRYWGTPLPAWVCDSDEQHIEFIGSLDELRSKSSKVGDDFDPHRPFIDEIYWKCDRADCDGTMHRTPEVIDVWYDSGAMPFAQWHYPFENREIAEKYFPADFICEGVDQTRGWFYSLMAISTLLDRGPAYRNVIVNDLVLDSEGQKMSKSKGNVVDPWDAIGEFGADSIRWYLITGSHPWLPKRFDAAAVREVQRKVFETLRSTYHFFSLYANIEGWTADSGHVPPVSERPLMDRWLAARLSATIDRVHEYLSDYNLTHAARAIGDFIVDDLSNWYVRRSRSRFWGSTDSADTQAAFGTLHDALVSVSLLMAPFAPFVADWLHRVLTSRSAHLGDFPKASFGDIRLEEGMAAVRQLSTLGRAARDEAGVRVRQPLGLMYAVTPPGLEIEEGLLEILSDELNVRKIEFLGAADDLVSFSAKPNFRALGSRFGKQTPIAAEAIRQLSSDEVARHHKGEVVQILVEGEAHPVQDGDLEVVQEASGDYAVQAEGSFTVALDPTITPELKSEGLARELVSRVQRMRKEADFDVADRIVLAVTAPAELRTAFQEHQAFVMAETLAKRFEVIDTGKVPAYAVAQELDLDGAMVAVALERFSVQEDG